MSVPLILRREALRTLSPLARRSRVLFGHRSIHSFPTLPYQEQEIPGLFSKKAFKTAWLDYQSHVVENLNNVTAGTEFESMDAMDIAIMTARQPDQASIFNYASQAYNNHFFFQGLAAEEIEMTVQFRSYITSTFTDAATLKAELFATANAMFGNGYVWLALDQASNLRILCTYNAGTPYGASYRRQNTDMNTGARLGDDASRFTSAIRHAARGGTSGAWVMPVLNVNVWEHAWLEDFGVLGKREYLEAWWRRVDWAVVQGRCPNKATTRQLLRK